MRKIVILLLYSIVLGSCGLSSLPTPTTPVFTKLADDTTSAPTIVLSKPDTVKLPIKVTNNSIDTSTTITIKIYPDHFSAEDFDGIVKKDVAVRQFTMDIDENEITYLRVNGKEYEGHEEHSFIAPTEYLPNGNIKVNKGATLNFICRYYSLNMKKLQNCNKIKNINHIEAGTILITKCKCDCE